MADNVTILDAADLDVDVAADEVGGVKIQRVKLIHGADGVNDGDVAAGNPLPVAVSTMPSVTVTGTFWQATQPVSLAALPALAAGTANIGDVDVLTIPARSATADSVAAKLATDAIHSGTTALTPKFAAISTASSGNSTVVAAVTGKKIRVLSYRVQAGGDVDFKFRDATAGVDLTGAMSTGAKGGGGGASFSPVGHFETASGNALSINLGAAVQTSGHLTYIEV